MDSVKSDVQAKIFFLSIIALAGVFGVTILVDNTLVPKFLMLSALLLVGILVLFTDRKRPAYQFQWMDALLFGWYAWNLIAVLWSNLIEEGLFQCQKALLLLLVYRFARGWLDRSPKISLRYCSLAGLILAIIAIAVVLFELLGIQKQGLSINRSTMYLVTAFSGHKNLVSGLLVLLLPLVCLNLFSEKGLIRKLSLNVAMLLIVLILVLQTRSVWLALAIGAAFGGVTWMLSKSQKSPAFLLTGLTLAGIFMSTVYFGFLHHPQPQSRNNAIQQASGQGGRSVSERLLIWDKTGEMIARQPIQGAGNGDWRLLFPDIGVDGINRLEIMVYAVNRPHNDFLWIWAELGIIGLLLFLALFGMAIWQGIQGLHQSDDPLKKQQILLVLSGLMIYLVFSFLDFPRERIEHRILLGIFLALAVHLGTPVRHKLPALPLPGKLWWAAGIGLLLFNLIMGGSRFQGEKHSKKLVGLKESKNWQGVINEARAAKSFHYRLEPGGNPIDWQIGVAQYNLGNLQGAIDAGLQAYEVNPYRPEVLNNLGSAYFGFEKYEESIPFYLEALRVNSGYDEAMFNLAAVYINTDRPQEAIEWLNKTQVNPEKKAQFMRIISNRGG